MGPLFGNGKNLKNFHFLSITIVTDEKQYAIQEVSYEIQHPSVHLIYHLPRSMGHPVWTGMGYDIRGCSDFCYLDHPTRVGRNAFSWRFYGDDGRDA